MSVKHLRTAVAALALVTVAAIPAHADPWARDHARGLNATSSPAGHALHARSTGLNQRYGLGASSSKPLVVYEDQSSDGFDWSSAGIGAAVVVAAAGAAAVTVRRRPAVNG
jgi:hypothetical protein